MENNAITDCLNGELKPGDLVLSTPNEDYACLVGTVLSISKLGTTEHASETENDTDGVHVNFMDSDYSERRIGEIEEMFSKLYGYPKPFGECPIDDTIMSPDTLIRITGIGGDALRAILDSHEAAEAMYRLVEMEPEIIHNLNQEQQPPAQTLSSEQEISNDFDADLLTAKLIERLNRNFSDYLDILRIMDVDEISGMWAEIAARMESHHYLTKVHEYDYDELEYFLKFKDPLSVMADELQKNGLEDYSDIICDILSKEDALQGDYPLITDAPTAASAPEKAAVTRDELLLQIAKKHCRFETLETRKSDSLDFRDVSVWGLKAALEEAYNAGLSRKISRTKGLVQDDIVMTPEAPAENVTEQIRSAESPVENDRDALTHILYEKLDRNLADNLTAYRDALANPSLATDELVRLANLVTDINSAHNFLQNEYDFEENELEILAKCSYPLDAVAAMWSDISDYIDISEGMRDFFKSSENIEDSPLISTVNQESSKIISDKPSVLAQIRSAAQTPKEPRRDKPAQDKSGPEH